MVKHRRPRAAIYCRISHDPQGREIGVERQERDCRELCAKRGWEVDEALVFVDNDLSASRKSRKPRPEWQRLVAALEAGAVEVLVAYHFDRLTRNPDELRHLIDAAERGVRIELLNGELRLDDPSGVLTARILAAAAESESASTSRRQKDKLRHDAASGKPHWAVRPFGHNFDGTAVESERLWIEQMAAWIVDEHLSATQVAVRLNEAGVGLEERARWQSSTVKSLLVSPRLVALREYKGEIVGEGRWDALLSRERWDEVRAAIDARSVGRLGGRRSMLTSLLRCGGCGQRLNRSSSGRHPTWQCTRHPDTGQGCGHCNIAAHLVEPLVVEFVLAMVGESSERLATTPAATADLAQLRGLHEELEELAAMYGRREITLGEWKAARAELGRRITEAEAAGTTTAAQRVLRKVAAQGSLRERWHELDMDAQRSIISAVLDHVRVDPPAKRGPRFDPSRVVPVWRE